MRFRILGPMEVTASGPDGAVVTPRAAKIRVVLATLLLRSGEVVSVDALIDELWGEEPPRTAMTTLQVYISQLRKLLRSAAPETGARALLTRAPGYVLRLGSGEGGPTGVPTGSADLADAWQYDVASFEALHTRGRTAYEEGRYEAAAALFRQGLALWRGPVLSDTPHGPLLGSAAVQLEEMRISALQQCLHAELRRGRHREVLAELQSLTAELPLHEEFHAQLMLALYRSGRQADALRVFGRLRRSLVDELAIEPGAPLQRLHGRILARDPKLLGTPRPPVRPGPARTPMPAVAPVFPVVRLPGNAGPFAGRDVELGCLDTFLTRASAGDAVLITGPAGVGKTALATAAAHHAAENFPDGRILLRLRSRDRTPRDTAQTLTALLRALGASPAETTAAGPPPSVAALQAAVREVVGERRLLLVLDDVTSAAQAGAVLDAVPGGVTVVTCRAVPQGLTGHGLPLGPLGRDTAHRLLAGAVSPSAGNGPADGAASWDGDALGDTDRAAEAQAAAEAAVAELVELCGGLPIVLVAVANRLAAHPGTSPAALVQQLRDGAAGVLAPEALRTLDEECHTVLRSAYEEASDTHRAAVRRLTLVAPVLLGARTAAAVLDEGQAGGRDTDAGCVPAVPDLVAAGLLVAGDGDSADDGHPVLPAPLRGVAARMLTRDEHPDVVRTVVARLCTELTEQVRAAGAARHVGGRSPLEWFGRRQSALASTVVAAHAAQAWGAAAQLAVAMSGFAEALADWGAWERGQRAGLDAARHLGDTAAQTRLLCSLGDLAWQRRRFGAAADCWTRALGLAGETGAARVRALVGLADLQLEAGTVEAGGVTELLAPACRDTTDPRDRWELHRVMGLMALRTQDTAAATAHFGQCHALAGTLGDRRLEAYARRRLDELDELGELDGRDGPEHGQILQEVRPGVWRTVLHVPARSGSEGPRPAPGNPDSAPRPSPATVPATV